MAPMKWEELLVAANRVADSAKVLTNPELYCFALCRLVVLVSLCVGTGRPGSTHYHWVGVASPV